MVILDPNPRSSTSQFELQKVDQSTWIVRNHDIPATDSQHVVACITESAVHGVDVLWLLPAGLPTHYPSARAVLDDLVRRDRRISRRTRPVAIPHFPPPHPHPC